MHVPPGTPPPRTPGLDRHASSKRVCSAGSTGTSDQLPISRILDRICYERANEPWGLGLLVGAEGRTSEI